MTDEEQDLLTAYLVDAGEIFPDLDVDVEDSVPGLVRGPPGHGVRRGPLQGHPPGSQGAKPEPREQARRDACPTVRPPEGLRPRCSVRLLRRAGLAEGYAQRRNDPLGDLNQYQGGMCISGDLEDCREDSMAPRITFRPEWVSTDSAVWRYVHFTLALV